MEEIWKPIKGYENLYLISNYGSVLGIKRNNILKPGKHEKGYLMVVLTKNGISKTYKVHRLVANTFLGEPNGMEVNHIDGDKTNNSVWNLEYCTHSENMAHAKSTGLIYKKAVAMLDDYGNVIKRFPSVSEAEHFTGAKAITRACNTGIRAKKYHWKFI